MTKARATDQGGMTKAQATDQGGLTKARATDQGGMTKARATDQGGMTKARAKHLLFQLIARTTHSKAVSVTVASCVSCTKDEATHT